MRDSFLASNFKCSKSKTKFIKECIRCLQREANLKIYIVFKIGANNSMEYNDFCALNVAPWTKEIKKKRKINIF